LALIVVDEEHDPSYKQQEGFRYSARDLAVMRAHRAGVPVILGSATPSLETLENALSGRYLKHLLPQRPGAAQPPRMQLVDLRRHAAEQGLSTPAMQAIGRHLQAGGQVIVFLNRRGYAPSLYCNACGWVAPCAHCDARMTLHRRARQLRCHHCGAHSDVPSVCGQCRQALLPLGQGTERVEETLARLFPEAPLARLDRDTAAARGAAAEVLDRVHSGEARILVGTQMLTKGHHFPDVSLVVILDADQGLFASDFRATERLAQTITQVAGRAGRESRAGEVIIQTEFPEHPLLTRLVAQGYESFAVGALDERREAAWPPYSRLGLLRAEARDPPRLDAWLKAAADAGHGLNEAGVKLLGPASALLARRADYFRAHLLVEAAARATLQRFLSRWLPLIENLPSTPGLRWSIDVDPLEVD
jgi:primosomal protein N' (replication factor Y)